MTDTLLGLIGAGLAWLAWEIAGDTIVDVIWWVTGPIRRPIWRAFVNASWPWPPLVMSTLGGAVAVAGFIRLDAVEVTGWRAGAALIGFFAGGLSALLSPMLWRDARRQRRRETSPLLRRS